MHSRIALIIALVVVALAVTLATPEGATANDVGQFKVAKGTVHIERAKQRVPVAVGTIVQEGDIVVTGADGSAGITFKDDSLLSIGPDSVLAIDRFAFDSTTHAGAFETSLRQGTMAAVSGKIAKQSADAMRVRTPATILGVRGTEFLVRSSGVTP
jgi:hypothetical protein